MGKEKEKGKLKKGKDERLNGKGKRKGKIKEGEGWTFKWERKSQMVGLIV